MRSPFRTTDSWTAAGWRGADGRRTRSLLLILAALTFVGLTGCESEKAATMPDVSGRRLDVALSDLERAGVQGDPEIVGGGTFGVVVESNWTVCEQLPPAGQAVKNGPRLVVERSCEESAPTTAETKEQAGPPETSVAPAEPLTAATNPELAAVLAEEDNCSASIETFADKYSGSLIEFDASISAMNNHGDRTTRYDILVAPGDAGGLSSTGPSFQLRDVGILDLGLTGANVPDTIGVNTKLRLVAEVGDFERPGCLLLLDPQSAEIR